MNKLMIMATALFMPLAGMAADRLYFEDFEMVPGSTQEVGMMLDNELVYSAIQADLYLPEGLAIALDDGDYDCWLTDRKGKNHTISAMLQPDGAVRVLIASQTSKTISGNSGAIAMFNMEASADFKGGRIELKNIVASEANATRHVLEDAACVVSVPGGEQPQEGGILTLSEQLLQLEVGETVQLAVTSEDVGTITWTSSNPEVANVDAAGLVTAVSSGLVAITATASTGATAWCAVSVELLGDVNRDGKIGIADVTRLINIILSEGE